MLEEDKSLFLKAMQDVTPLESQNKKNHYQSKVIKQAQKALIKKVRKNHHKASKHELAVQPGFIDKTRYIKKVTAFESLYYHQKGVRLQELSKLKKGEFTIQAVLDIHGYTLDQAEEHIIEFISQALLNKHRFIRIIHGKGYNSEEEYPPLKNLTNQILQQTKPIIAYCSTPQKDGGTGAVNILLKAQ